MKLMIRHNRQLLTLQHDNTANNDYSTTTIIIFFYYFIIINIITN